MNADVEIKSIDRKIAYRWANIKREGTTQEQRSKWLDEIALLAIRRLEICLEENKS